MNSKLFESKRSCCKSFEAGVTILEALFVAFIMSIILGAIAYALRGYARVTVQSSTKDRVMAGASAALETIRSDVAAAYTLQSDSGNPRLLVQRVDPAKLARVDSVPSPELWDPFKPDHLVEVRYEVVDRQLLRTVTQPNEPGSTQVLAGEILDFQCLNGGRGRYDVTISFEETAKRTDIKSIVVRRIGQEPKLRR